MSETNNKIRQVLCRALIGGLIFVASFSIACAQSSSTNYNAVDFLNAESSLSSSSNYQLDDSIDYYGGVNSSSSYNECTGDFAVLGPCSASATPPTPPPPPPLPPDDPFGWCPECLHGPEFPEDPPEEEPTPPIEPDFSFILPGIEEPQPIPEEPEIVPEPEVVPEPTPVMIPAVPAEKESILILPQEALHTVAPEYCYDLTCSEANLLRPAAKVVESYEGVCRIYSFGGFGYNINCSDYYIIWLGVLFFVIGMFPISIQVVRRKTENMKK